MDQSLSAARIRVPPLPDRVVNREQLTQRLEREVPRHKLVVVAAATGYGKTTLLAQWARASRHSIVWLSLDDDDDDVGRLFRSLTAAWESVRPDVASSPLALLARSFEPDRDRLLASFLDVASDGEGHTVFVLDDAHLLDDSAVISAMERVIQRLPSSVHFVLSGRAEPGLPLARYRARREVLELDTTDLQFLPAETDAFLRDVAGLRLPDDEVSSLHEQLEGWPAGIYLVSLAINRRPEMPRPVVVGGRQRFIADYLRDEVFNQLADDDRRFVLQTCILDELNASLCDAVRDSRDSREVLDRLERVRAFVVPLDNDREWYRYHRLFAEFLRDELSRHDQSERATLHRRAAVWRLDHQMPDAALHHAIQAEDVDLAVAVTERHAFAMVVGGEVRRVERWLGTVPDSWFVAQPILALARAAVLLLRGALDACSQRLDALETTLRGASRPDIARRLAEVNAIRCFVACFVNDLPTAEACAERALPDLPADDLNFRPGIFGALGDTYRRNGRWREARTSYMKLLDYAHAPASRSEAVHLCGALADLELLQGHLHQAAVYWRQALALVERPEYRGTVPLPLAGWVYLRYGELLCEWNQLSDAWSFVSRGLERAELGGDGRTLVAGYLAAARIRLAEQDSDGAAEFLERVRPLLEGLPLAEWISRFGRLQLDIWLAQGQARSATSWAERVDIPPPPDGDAVSLAVARVLLLDGRADSISRSQSIVRSILARAEAEGRLHVEVEALALLALIWWRRGDQATAMTSLERALRRAEPEGYARLFTDLGMPMTQLLREARSRGVMPEYVTRLIDTLGPMSGDHSPAMLEPLTRREQEILELLGAGLTNQKIAERLSITAETVKKHAGNIYGKLGARGRTDAVARARAAGMLP